MQTSKLLIFLFLMFFALSCSNDSTTSPGNPNPSAPEDSTVKLISPPNDTVFVLVDSINIIFKWFKTANASVYHLQFSGDSAFSYYPDNYYTNDTVFTKKFNAPQAFPTYWRVRIFNPIAYPIWSNVWHFRFQ